MTSINPTLGVQLVPEYLANGDEHRRLIARGVNSALKGKINVTLDVTLTANTASTTVKDSRISYYSAVIPAMPMTSNGAACLAAGIYVDTFLPPVGATPGSAVVHHRNNAATDQTIRFIITG